MKKKKKFVFLKEPTIFDASRFLLLVSVETIEIQVIVNNQWQPDHCCELHWFDLRAGDDLTINDKQQQQQKHTTYLYTF